jgi:hypothetical protein
MQKSGNIVAALFVITSPFAETSPDAGPRCNGPLFGSTIAAAVLFIGREDKLDARRGPGVVSCMS